MRLDIAAEGLLYRLQNKNLKRKGVNQINENTSTSNNRPAPKSFDIIDGNTLMAQEYEPLQFAVEKILPHGLFILAGNGKIGKSWLFLDLCVNVATGSKLWDFSSEQGDVLYLALEDNYPRLQDRLKRIRDTGVRQKHLCLRLPPHDDSARDYE